MGARVLVADDDRSTRLIQERILKNEGFEVLLAGDGLEAWNIVCTQSPDLVLCDWMMPGLDGVDLCRQIKSDPFLRAIYVIIVTAKGQGEDKVLALEAGADEFLTKPVDVAELKARVKVGLRVVEYQKGLRTTALTDDLTGLANRRAFQDSLRQESARARRYGTPFSLLIIDVNRFKTINDRYGHDRGDQVLRLVAQRIVGALRSSDKVFRIGGDEFAVLLPDAKDQAQLAAARFSAAFGDPDDSKPVDPEHPTVSVGVATYECSKDFEDLFRSADADMYKDKTGARRRLRPDGPSDGSDRSDRSDTSESVLIVRGQAVRLGPLAQQLAAEGFSVSFGRDPNPVASERSEPPGGTA
jgi:diguanylate cyclase (GGDEF)-like protein